MRCRVRDGFEFVAILYPYNKPDAIMITEDRPVEEYLAYINMHSIEKAEIVMPDLRFLKFCPTLKYLRICPSYNAPADFDFSPLYELPEIKFLSCLNKYGDREQYIGEIDYLRIRGLVDLSVNANKGSLNYSKVDSLKSLYVGDFKGQNRDLTDLFSSKELDTLRMTGCGIRSLNGIEKTSKLQCLYLHYNRPLEDITALRKVRKTLKTLRIENCPRIADFSVLAELENLELLELAGSNVLPSLDFLRSMKKLKTFVFNMNVLDGDLSPCLGLSYVYSEKNRKHFNLKDIELPKGEYVRGNESIEEWRRLE